MNDVPDSPGVSLYNGRVVFETHTPANNRPSLPAIAPLNFYAQFSGDRQIPVNLDTYPIRGIANEAARIIWRETQPTGRYKSPGAVQDIVQALSRLGDMIVARGWQGRVQQLADVTADDLNEFENFLYERHGDESGTPYRRLTYIVAFMRLALELGLASEGIRDRLRFVSHRGCNYRTAKPREPYSAYVAEQLRLAALQDMESAITRLTVEGARFIADGHDPNVAGWHIPANVIWALSNGVIDTAMDAPSHAHWNLRSFRTFSGTEYDFADLVRFVHLTQDDAIAFIIFLSLETGLPKESVEALEEDCLQNEAKNYVTLRYVKRRKGGSGHTQTKRVKTKSRFSPGAVIKILKTLSRRTRDRLIDAGAHDEAKWLFVGHARSSMRDRGILRRLRARTIACDRFCARHTILDDQGRRLTTVTLNRLRKTYKAERYQKVGNLADAAGDHTKNIHARHYADVAALRHLHEQTITEALEQALHAAMEPIVVSKDLEHRLFRRIHNLRQ